MTDVSKDAMTLAFVKASGVHWDEFDICGHPSVIMEAVREGLESSGFSPCDICDRLFDEGELEEHDTQLMCHECFADAKPRLPRVEPPAVLAAMDVLRSKSD